MKKTEANAYKIAILGLANAGKTSIIKVLTREFDMLTLIKPTTSVERSNLEFLGKDLIFWDFGGQDHYRENYLAKPERYFNGITKVFYVVDVQDPLLVIPNVSYFRGVLKAVQEYSPVADFVILFHKDDPDFIIADKLQSAKQQFLDAVMPLLDETETPVCLYETSIYKPLTIVTAVSQPIFAQQDLFDNVATILKTFTDTYGLLFSILFTKNFFSIGNHIADRFQPETSMHDVLKKFYQEFTPDADKDKHFELYVEKFKILCARFDIHFGKDPLPFHLAIGYDGESVLEKDGLNVALDRMNENLKKIFENVDLEKILEKADAA